MRHSLCPPGSLLLALAASAGFLSQPGFAQGKPGKPLKPEQLIKAAQTDNGLDSSHITPWHFKAQFTITDEPAKDGSNDSNSGTLEQWWWSPTSYKSVWTSKTLNQTDIATKAGLFRTGDARWESRQEHLVDALIHDPVGQYHYDPKQYDLTDQMEGTGNSRLRCLFLSKVRAMDAPLGLQSAVHTENLPGLCFEPDTTALRVMTSGGGGDTILLGSLGEFGGRFVAKTIQVGRGGKVSLNVQVQTVEALQGMAPPEAPAGVEPLHGPIDLPENRLRLLTHVDITPTLQTYSSQQLTPVTFVAKFRVGTNGHVLDATIVGGPPGSDITASMIKVIKQQVFEPFRILETPVEVNTSYTFHLGGGPGSDGGRGGRSR